MSEHPFGKKLEVVEHLQFPDGSGVSYHKVFQ